MCSAAPLCGWTKRAGLCLRLWSILLYVAVIYGVDDAKAEMEPADISTACPDTFNFCPELRERLGKGTCLSLTANKSYRREEDPCGKELLLKEEEITQISECLSNTTFVLVDSEDLTGSFCPLYDAGERRVLRRHCSLQMSVICRSLPLPVVVKSFRIVTPRKGRSFDLTCEIKSRLPVSSIKIFREPDTELEGVTSTNYNMTSLKVSVDSASCNHTWKYRCEAEDSGGNTAIETTVVAVEYCPPVWYPEPPRPKTITANIGEQKTIVMELISDETISSGRITWFKDGRRRWDGPTVKGGPKRLVTVQMKPNKADDYGQWELQIRFFPGFTANYNFSLQYEGPPTQCSGRDQVQKLSVPFWSDGEITVCILSADAENIEVVDPQGGGPNPTLTANVLSSASATGTRDLVVRVDRMSEADIGRWTVPVHDGVNNLNVTVDVWPTGNAVLCEEESQEKTVEASAGHTLEFSVCFLSLGGLNMVNNIKQITSVLPNEGNLNKAVVFSTSTKSEDDLRVRHRVHFYTTKVIQASHFGLWSFDVNVWARLSSLLVNRATFFFTLQPRDDDLQSSKERLPTNHKEGGVPLIPVVVGVVVAAGVLLVAVVVVVVVYRRRAAARRNRKPMMHNAATNTEVRTQQQLRQEQRQQKQHQQQRKQNQQQQDYSNQLASGPEEETRNSLLHPQENGEHEYATADSIEEESAQQQFLPPQQLEQQQQQDYSNLFLLHSKRKRPL